MATKKHRRLNPYHPKVKLYAYGIKPKNKRSSTTVASGWAFGLSIAQLKEKFYSTYDPKYYTYTVKQIPKTRLGHNYKFDSRVNNTTNLYLN